ncbi:hypothetical protein A3A79_04865 [Candidatus Gottesmanbacteria bacterium RIFCSPLOWO2_01_FULL_43_11b]|uniref:Methyltransferase type 11 domain-containing protein n=1 Tax=Candidatus Gottesmanbacteria bacterium RIFCSPLOWO2_01_FULL_43_11b TaxID=1798392 RepID=A0A1F6AJQ4_9BACT|nr:MAG: hypothetical protein A3A79_04865 [Candidatus Gottesmanbacteria bacterium RIFCSPLOWO2_01_FULL_43_11b]
MKRLPYSSTDARVLDTKDRHRVAKQIQAVLEDFLGSRLNAAHTLDVGCSSGAITYYLSSSVKSMIGVDIDKNAISLARKDFKKKNLRFFQANGLHLPFPDESFDVIICNEVYSYVPNDRKLMNEIFRVLKPRGCCYFSGGNTLYPIESRYHIPFLHNLPDLVAIKLFWLLHRKPYYVAHYKTYWELKKLLKNFVISDYTTKILSDPKRFSFTKLYSVSEITKYMPLPVLRMLEPFLPTFIFILSKDLRGHIPAQKP